jgi:chloramphenicol 3-O phosphotransferase
MFEGVWMNLGVHRFKLMTPEHYQPGIGLRTGGERPDLEPLVVVLYRAMYEAIAAHSRLGLEERHPHRVPVGSGQPDW